MPDSKSVYMEFSAYRGAERGMLRLTLDAGCNVNRPYAQRNRRDNPVLVPNSDARGLDELLPLHSGRGGRTYTRSTINSEAATKAR